MHILKYIILIGFYLFSLYGAFVVGAFSYNPADIVGLEQNKQLIEQNSAQVDGYNALVDKYNKLQMECNLK